MIEPWLLIPFVVMLLCIAILPMLPKVEHWWENNLHKLYVSLILGVPVAVYLCMNGMGHNLEHQMLFDYIPLQNQTLTTASNRLASVYSREINLTSSLSSNESLYHMLGIHDADDLRSEEHTSELQSR